MVTRWADADFPIVATNDGVAYLDADWRVTVRLSVFDVVRSSVFVVPAGFSSDGASVPRALWWLCGDPMERPRLYAALLHDWLYTTGVVSRAEADAIYYAMLRHFGYSPMDASVNYLAVRLFGSRHYGRRAA